MVVLFCLSFFFNDPATTVIYTLSLHDALPISSTRRWRNFTWPRRWSTSKPGGRRRRTTPPGSAGPSARRSSSRRGCPARSEEHTSELQSHVNLVCRLLLEKKKKNKTKYLIS